MVIIYKPYQSETLLYSKAKITLSKNRDIKPNHATSKSDLTDATLTQRITKFRNTVNQEKVSRIPLRMLNDLGLVRFVFQVWN